MYLSEAGRTHNLVNPFEPGEGVSRGLQSVADEELLRRCAEGNNAALEELVQRYQRPLGRLLFRLLASREDVEEALLTVFLKVWQFAPRFQYRASIHTWLFRIAVNVAHDRDRLRRRRPQTVSGELAEAASPQGNAEDEALRRLGRREQSQALACALQRLQPGDRLLLVLYYYEQMGYEEIQAITQTTYLVLKTRLSRARRRLRQLLEEEDRAKEDRDRDTREAKP